MVWAIAPIGAQAPGGVPIGTRGVALIEYVDGFSTLRVRFDGYGERFVFYTSLTTDPEEAIRYQLMQ